MRIAIFIDKAELHHRIVTLKMRFHMRDAVMLKMFLKLLLKNVHRVCEIYF